MMRPGALQTAAGVLMIAATALAVVLTPTAKSSTDNYVELEAIIPQQFGAWRVVPTAEELADLAPRNVDDEPRKFYDATLMRTYKSVDGAVVMLAVAYGKNQRQEAKIHRPELCYTAQGFQVTAKHAKVVDVAEGKVPAVQLLAKSAQRLEPITYWIRIGDKFSQDPLALRLSILFAGVGGRIPDGALVRVSSALPLGADPAAQYPLQREFLRELTAALSPKGRRLVLGEWGGRD
jgi:EpsI family protein